jgi:hypothetical protein
VAWTPVIAEEWIALRDQYKNAYRTMSSATVASWEVASTDLHRLLKASRGKDVAAHWTERFSDALVPALGAIQDVERAGNALWKKTTEAAESTGTMDTALAHLAAQSRTVGGAFAAAWPKTTEYLEPLYEALGAQDQDRAEMLAVGAKAGAGLDRAAEGFATSLAGVAVSPEFVRAFLDAVEVYRHAAEREIELSLEEVRGVMVRMASRP